MSSSTHQIKVKATDETSSAFKSIESRAGAAAGNITRVISGAIAAAGAYLSFRAINDGVKELGSLSDMAAKTGSSVEFLTQTIAAFEVGGIKVNMEQLAKAMLRMQRRTGQTGEEGFIGTLRSLAAIEDPIKRSAEAVRIFGESGQEMQPLISNGQELVDKYIALKDAMPGVSSAAANAGDAIADAQSILGNWLKKMWYDWLGSILSIFCQDMPGGVRAGAEAAIAHMEALLTKSKAKISAWGTNLLASFAWWKDVVQLGKDQADQIFASTVNAANREAEQMAADADRRLEEKIKELKNRTSEFYDLGSGKPALAAASNSLAEVVTDAVAAKIPQVRNALIGGGTNEALRLAANGPQVAESRKQTTILKQIADNTAKTANSASSDDLEAFRTL